MVAKTRSGTALPVASSSADHLRATWRRIGIGAFCLYVVWNVYWLAHRAIPPSILLAVAGIPAPTTGCTRAAVALWHGDLRLSLFWNAFLIPIVLLLLASGTSLAKAFVRKNRLILPAAIARLWLAVLASAWITKLLQGREAF